MATTKSPSERIDKIYKIVIYFANVFGINVLCDEYSLTMRTYQIVFIITAFFICIFRTIYTLLAKEDPDWATVLRAVCAITIAMKGALKLFNGIFYSKEIYYIYLEVTNMYRVYEKNPNEVYRKHLNRTLYLVTQMAYNLLKMYIIAMTIIVAVPMYHLVINQRRLLILEVVFPGIDSTTEFGYYFYLGPHVIFVLIGIFGNFVNDVFLFLGVAHIPLMSTILECKFNEMDEVIAMEPSNDNKEKIQLMLRDIFQWHQKYMEFSETCKRGFYWVIFFQVCSSFFGVVSAIFCIFFDEFPNAPGFLALELLPLYAYCALGNIVEIANDDVTLCIYDSDWCSLTVPQQKMILIMLRESQQQKGITIGGVCPLSMNTALQLTKTMYTFSMMLQQFSD